MTLDERDQDESAPDLEVASDADELTEVSADAPETSDSVEISSAEDDVAEDADEEEQESVASLPSTDEVDEDDPSRKDWYILKVQSNRENSICDGLRRRVAVEGLDEYFGEILVPTEDVAEFKNGKRKVVKRKLYPGYIVVHMALNDETWFLVRETPGIGDFTGPV